MKHLLLILAVCFTGCSSTNISKNIQSLSKDQAIVRFRVTSIYGTVDFVRVGTTNGVTIAPDGTITAK